MASEPAVIQRAPSQSVSWPTGMASSPPPRKVAVESEARLGRRDTEIAHDERQERRVIDEDERLRAGDDARQEQRGLVPALGSRGPAHVARL